MPPKQMVNILDGQLADAHDEIARLTAALSTARNDALQEAVVEVAILEGKWHEAWRAGHKGDQHMEGQSDGASECLHAITTLIARTAMGGE